MSALGLQSDIVNPIASGPVVPPAQIIYPTGLAYKPDVKKIDNIVKIEDQPVLEVISKRKVPTSHDTDLMIEENKELLNSPLIMENSKDIKAVYTEKAVPWIIS